MKRSVYLRTILSAVYLIAFSVMEFHSVLLMGEYRMMRILLSVQVL